MKSKATFDENIKPSIGMIVRLTTNAGLWQVLDRAPGVGLWWMLAFDDEARGATPCIAAPPTARCASVNGPVTK